MQPLIPSFVLQRLLSGQLTGEQEAFALNIDLSGFTPLTESLMKEGIVGAERLSNILNDIFEPLVKLVYARGGFIPYFAGDAFTAIFLFPLDQQHAVFLLETAALARRFFEERDCRFGGQYRIGLKAGLAAGTIRYGVVGKTTKAYYFRGPAIQQAAFCQTQANEAEIVVGDRTRSLLEGSAAVCEEVAVGAYRLVGEVPGTTRKVVPASPDYEAFPADVVRRFLPTAIVDHEQSGEFRTVVSTFLSFDAIPTHETLDLFATLILEQLSDFGGYFKEVDYGDKGSLMVIFFGAPVSYENNSVRALEFALTLQAELEALRTTHQLDFRFRAGITIGTAYTGFIGGKERKQYACVGTCVNLAARIMSSADWQDILVDGELAESSYFRFASRGEVRYKGIQQPVATFALSGRKQTLGKPNYGGELIGREEEVRRLVAFAQPLFKQQPAGIAYVLGEAGIGKSRLTFEVRRQLNQQHTLNWLLASTDQILRKPFNPFTYLLQRMFRQSLELSNLQNQRRFQFRLNQIRQGLRKVKSPRVKTVLQELRRTESVLAAQLGIVMERSLWTQLDAQGRYQNTIAAIVNLLVAEVLTQPTVLEMEDIHWIDDDSITVIRELIRQTKDLPLLILATSRASDTGVYTPLVSPVEKQAAALPVIQVEITPLSEDAVRRLAEATLGAPIAEDTLNTLLRTTNFNPFYLEQVLEYFRENDLLISDEEGVLTLSDESIRLSSSISSILTARIDRLSNLVRETVKAAAVIGREFDVPILNEVMCEDTGITSPEEMTSLLREQIASAEKGQIWSAVNELRYIFRHSLLREAVYSMQLTARLQQLHGQIANAILKLYHDNIEERYVDLAFHYEQAGEKELTIEYLGKAANYARSNFQNQQALDLYERLIEKFSHRPEEEITVNTHINRGKVLEIVGRWEEARAAYEQAQAIAKASRDILLLGRTNNHLGRLLTLLGENDKAMEHLRVAASLFESVDDIFGIAKTYSSMGNLYFRTAHYHDALTYYNKSLEHGFGKTGTTSAADTVAHLGLTYMNLGDYPQAIQVVQEQIPHHEENQDSMGLANLHTNLGIIYFESGDYKKAMQHHHTGLELAKELGDKRLQAIGLGSLGSVMEREGRFEEAEELFLRDLDICEEMGDRQGIAVTEGLIGDINSVMGNFTVAIQHLDRSLRISRELGYRKGVAKAVNTLGDIYYLQRQYEVSLMYYNQAIDIARATNNLLVLCSSLEEKGRVLLADGQIEALQEVEEEARTIAAEIGNPDVVIGTRILQAQALAAGAPQQTATALAQLEKIRKHKELNPEQRAHISMVIYELSGHLNQQARQQALELYEQLYAATPKFIYKHHIQLLR